MAVVWYCGRDVSGCIQAMLADYIPDRAVCSITHAVTLNDTTDGVVSTPKAYVTGSFTPAANDLLIVCAWFPTTATGNTGTMACADSGGIAFTQVASITQATRSVAIFVANSLAAASSRTVTITATPPAGLTVAGCNITVLRVAGMARTGASAARQSKTASFAAAGTPSLAFDSAALTNNPCIGMIANLSNPAGVTPPASWTEVPTPDTGFATPASGIETAAISNGFTGTTVTWGSSSATGGNVIIAELDNT